MPTPDARFHAVHDAVLVPREDGVDVPVRVRTRGRAPERVHLRTEPDHEERLVELALLGERDGWRTYGGSLRAVEHDPVTHYAFQFLFPGEQRWLAQDGLTPFVPALDLHFRLVPSYRPATWVWDQVFYQVFPERFRDGDPSNNVRDGAYTYGGAPVVARGWDELPTPGNGPREFFGGDLQGVRHALPYLTRLGVTALYLNPIFTSPSSHKYDTVDYDRVDPHLGGDAAFADLLRGARDRGMRVVLDAVVNHTSERHPWFGKGDPHAEPAPDAAGAEAAHAAPPGAFRDPGSPTRDHYVFDDPSDPESYRGWVGVRTLPVLDFASEGVRDKVYAGPDAILRRWLRPPWRVDGWRLDVAHMMGRGPGAHGNHELLREIRTAIREERPDAYVLGEHFFEAGDWLQGDQEDGAMNYDGFLRPLLAFLAGVDFRGHGGRVDAAALDAWLTRSRARLPFPIQLSQFNLLGSHDVPRIRTRLGGETSLVVAAMHLLFTYLGVPCIYYGDEVGLEGGPDPDCRRPFPWDEARWDRATLEAVRALAHLRRAAPALARGRLETLFADGDTFAYARVLDGTAIVTAVHRGGEPRPVTLPVWATGVTGPWHDVLAGTVHGGARPGATDQLTLVLAPRSAVTLASPGAVAGTSSGRPDGAAVATAP